MPVSGILCQPEEKTVTYLAVTLCNRPVEAIQPVLDGTVQNRFAIFEMGAWRAPGWPIEAIHLGVRTWSLRVALFGITRVMTGEFANDLLPDVQALRHVPHRL